MSARETVLWRHGSTPGRLNKEVTVTEVYEDDDFDEIDDDKPQRSDSEWAELRRAKKAREKAERELAEMKKQIAFSKAGIDPDDPKARYFVKGYDGDMSAEAIRAEAVKAGFLSEPTDDQNPQAVQQEADITSASLGAEPEGANGVAVGALDQAFATGGVEGMMAFLSEHGVPINREQ